MWQTLFKPEKYIYIRQSNSSCRQQQSSNHSSHHSSTLSSTSRRTQWWNSPRSGPPVSSQAPSNSSMSRQQQICGCSSQQDEQLQRRQQQGGRAVGGAPRAGSFTLGAVLNNIDKAATEAQDGDLDDDNDQLLPPSTQARQQQPQPLPAVQAVHQQQGAQPPETAAPG